MKRILSILLILSLALSVAACGSAQTTSAAASPTGTPGGAPTDAPAPTDSAPPAEPRAAAARVEVERVSETVTDQSGTRQLLNYFAEHPHVVLSDSAAAEKINAVLDEDYRLFSEGEEGTDWSGFSSFQEAARNEYDSRMADGTIDAFYTYELTRRVDVARGDDRVLSLTYFDSTFSNGAHGYGALMGVSFDLRTGEKLRLEDLSDDPAGFLEECAEKLWRESRGGEHAALALGGYFPDYEKDLPGLLRDGNWYFGDEGIVVIANPYELAPYASGRIEFTLPYEWLRWYMREEYLPAEPETPGALRGEILDTDPAADFVLDDGTDGQGARVLFTAEGGAEEIRLTRVGWYESFDGWYDDGTLWYASHMDDGETLLLRTWIGDVFPTLKISWRTGSGREERLIFQSGKDGSLVLLDGSGQQLLPMEISKKLPFAFDLDGDGEKETIDLRNTGSGSGSDTHWQLTVDGLPAEDVYALSSEMISLWLADLDADGISEILYSGDMGSDDYATCAWHGDTLERIWFTGETRHGRDSSEQTPIADGLATFSYGRLYLESMTYQLGTYASVRAYEYTGGVIAPEANPWDGAAYWSYTSNRNWITLASALGVSWEDGTAGRLDAGEEILLLSTDGSTVRFRTRGERIGSIRLEYARDENGLFGCYIDGRPETEYFQRLPYAG